MNNTRFAVGLAALLIVISAGAIVLADSEQVDAAQYQDVTLLYNGENYEVVYSGSEDVDGGIITVSIRTAAGSPTTFNGTFDGNTAVITPMGEGQGITAAGNVTIQTIGIFSADHSMIMSATPNITDTIVQVSFDAGEGTGSQSGVLVSTGYGYTLPNFEDTGLMAPSGMYFVGWDVNGTQYNEGDVVTINGTTTITPVYDGTAPVEQYTVTISVNNGEWGSVDVQSVRVPSGTQFTTDGTVLTIGDYTVNATPVASTDEWIYSFAGWNPESGTVNGNMEIVANFTQTSASQTYTITWYDEDRTTVLYTDEVPYGEMPVYRGETPTKESTDQYTYEFAGWTPVMTEATADAQYYATYTPTLRTYTVTWADEDGTVLETDENVSYGETPEYNGETPAKESDDQYDYAFAGWNPAVSAVTGDITYTATYTPTLRTYTVTWVVDGQDNIIQEYEYGATPEYPNGTPVKESTDQYTYEFAGWTPEIASVTGDAQYEAVFTPTLRTYTVTWVNWDGTVLDTFTDVAYGATPVYDGETPVREADAQYTYTFTGWDPEISAVTGDATYTAQYESTVNKYTVTWVNWDGTVLETDVDVPYGTVPVYDGADPTRPATSDTTYVFKGFAASADTPLGDDGSIIGNTTMVATYEANVNFGGYDITLDYGFGGSVSVAPSATDPSVAVLTISPSTGFYVVSVDIDPISEATVVYRGDVNGVMTYEIMDIRSDLTVDVMFMSIDSGDDDPVPNPPVVIVPGDDGNGAIIVAAAAAVLIIVFAAVYIIYGRKS